MKQAAQNTRSLSELSEGLVQILAGLNDAAREIGAVPAECAGLSSNVIPANFTAKPTPARVENVLRTADTCGAKSVVIAYAGQARTLTRDGNKWLADSPLLSSIAANYTPAEPAQTETESEEIPTETAPAAPETTLEDELATLELNGRCVILPKQALAHYAEIKARLTDAGGRYTRNQFQFSTETEAAEMLAQIKAGQTPNPVKEQQFFPTPAALAERVVAAANITPGARVLEPSAGYGALANVAQAAGAEVLCVESWNKAQTVLESQGYTPITADFLTLTPAEIGLFDAVVANPPFTKNQDIAHTVHMFQFLKSGGVLSVITSQSWTREGTKAQREFAQFCRDNKAEITEIPAGTFAETGTNVATLHIVITKP